MAADPNMGSRHGAAPAPFYNRHMASFQPGPMSTTAGMAPGGVSGPAGVFNPGAVNSTCAAGGALLDPVPGLRRDAGLANDWTFEEQAVLTEGLDIYADEPGIMKYIKIAAMLRDKTVRDIALRCRWMTKKEHGKRRKPEGHYVGKKLKTGKEKMVDSYSKANIYTVNSDNMASYSLMTHHVNHNDQFSCEAPAFDGPKRNLMDENAQVFSQIAANLATFKIQDNIDLFCCTKNNIEAILNSMSEMPGIMSQMPPLPVSVDEQLLSIILPGTSQALTFGAPGGIHLKQEPRC